LVFDAAGMASLVVDFAGRSDNTPVYALVEK
jgi:hypothetical protein